MLVAPLFAAASGVALLVSHAPVSWWWASFLHAPLLVAALWWDEQGRSARFGAIAGVAAFAPMISWLIAPAGIVGWGLLVAVQVGWYALLAWLLGRLRDHALLPLVAAMVVTGIDAWRGIVPLNGFEWGAIAYAHGDSSWLLPVARVAGGRGITFLVVLIGVGALVFARSVWRKHREAEDRGINGDAARTIEAFDAARVPAAQLLVGLVASALLVADAPEPTGTLDVLVVQGNDIRHWEEPVSDPPLHITTNLRDQTLRALEAGGPADLVVWPESSVDRDPASPAGASLAPLLDEAVHAAGELLAGTTLDGPDATTERYVAASRYIAGQGEVDRYVKRRLVPFGEYVPARALLDWFPPLEQVPRDAISGGGPDAMATRDGVRLAIVICFETLFADIVRSNVLAEEQPAELVLTLTNDASFQDSAEPDQHLAQSRLRAVETGRWVVHAALSGSSAFVDPHGGIHDATPVFTATTIRRDVPLVEARTPFLVVGDLTGHATRVGVFGLALLGVARRRR